MALLFRNADLVSSRFNVGCVKPFWHIRKAQRNESIPGGDALRLAHPTKLDII
jgi:hypothetical protein